MLALTTAEITHGGPRRTTTRTSQWYVLSVRVRVRSGQGWGGGRSAVPTGCDLRFRSPVHTGTLRPRSAWRKLQTVHGSARRCALRSPSAVHIPLLLSAALLSSALRVRAGGADSAVRLIGRATCDTARLCIRGPRVRGARGESCKLHDTNVLAVPIASPESPHRCWARGAKPRAQQRQHAIAQLARGSRAGSSRGQPAPRRGRTLPLHLPPLPSDVL